MVKNMSKFEQGMASGEIIREEQHREIKPGDEPRVILEEGLMKEEMSDEELRAREQEAADLLRKDISAQRKFELNQKVRVRGEEGEWYYLGEDEHGAVLANLPDTPADRKKEKQYKLGVNVEDLEKAGQRQFKVGDIVKVRRTGGKIEDGWVVSHNIGEGAQDVYVIKEDPTTGEAMGKRVSLKDLREVNKLDAE